MNNTNEEPISWLPELRFSFKALTLILVVCDIAFLSLYFRVWIHFGDKPNPLHHDLIEDQLYQDQWSMHCALALWSMCIGFIAFFGLTILLISMLFNKDLRPKPYPLTLCMIAILIYDYCYFFDLFEWFID
ncbi:MAG: hypothetical protein IT258_01840 [Saprospiraceae bacterium]|nr:hypothetical protein [Saprospiraceae bacterium]